MLIWDLATSREDRKVVSLLYYRFDSFYYLISGKMSASKSTSIESQEIETVTLKTFIQKIV